MRRPIGFAVGVVAAAALAGGAAGKAPPTGIEICGQSGCKTVAPEQAERIVTQALYGSTAEPAAPAPHFLVRWQWPERPEQRTWWIPESGVVRGPNGQWFSQSVASEASLRAAAAGLSPLPTPTLTRVVVGGRVAENPQSYLRLLRGGQLAPSFDGARGFVGVRLTSLEASPWTNGATWLMVSNARNFVWRDVWVYGISPALAERARQGRSLTPFARAG